MLFVAERHKILIAFSAYTNGKKIITINNQPGQILIFNGLKVISMFWVVLGHRFEVDEVMAINKADVEEVSPKIIIKYIFIKMPLFSGVQNGMPCTFSCFH